MENFLPIPERYLEKFVLSFQSSSGLSYKNNPIVKYYVEALRVLIVSPDLNLDEVIEKFVGAALVISHELYHKSKTWKSYDW